MLLYKKIGRNAREKCKKSEKSCYLGENVEEFLEIYRIN